MWKRILSFIKSYLPRSRSTNMDTKPITFVITTAVSFGDDGDWRRKVRAVRSTIKEAIKKDPDFKVLKVESKEE